MSLPTPSLAQLVAATTCALTLGILAGISLTTWLIARRHSQHAQPARPEIIIVQSGPAQPAIHPTPFLIPPPTDSETGRVAYTRWQTNQLNIIGGWPGPDEAGPDPRPSSTPHTSDHQPAPDHLPPSPSSHARTSRTAPEQLPNPTQADPPDLVEAARSLTLRQLRQQYNIGYSRARRLIDTYQPERGNHNVNHQPRAEEPYHEPASRQDT